MTVMLLHEAKLNVVFERSDLVSHGLSYDKLNYREGATRKIFKEALALAKSQVGFCADSGRLFVEAFPCAGGGCIVSFTKLKKVDLEAGECGYNAIYIIDGTDRMLAALEILKNSGINHLIFFLGERYYFVLTYPLASLLEYGEAAENVELVYNQLCEAGKLLIAANS